MSQVDFTAALRHIVAQMKESGKTPAEIIALIIGESTTKPAPVAAPETERLVSIELANGITKLVPASAAPAPARANSYAVVTAPCLVEWVKPEGFVPDVIPAPAPKPVVSDAKEIVFVRSRNTTYDAQVESYQEPWSGPVPSATTEDTADLDALIRETEADLAKLRTLRGSK